MIYLFESNNIYIIVCFISELMLKDVAKGNNGSKDSNVPLSCYEMSKRSS